jgi:hypothetical protein
VTSPLLVYQDVDRITYKDEVYMQVHFSYILKSSINITFQLDALLFISILPTYYIESVSHIFLCTTRLFFKLFLDLSNWSQKRTSSDAEARKTNLNTYVLCHTTFFYWCMSQRSTYFIPPSNWKKQRLDKFK